MRVHAIKGGERLILFEEAVPNVIMINFDGR